jgi:Pvc16 N-terminal domain
MSDTRAIAAVTVTLRHRLQQALAGTGASVSVTRPGIDGNGQPPASVNLFLYQVTPNGAWRNDDLPTRRADGRLLRRPQAALDLHYLLSFYGEDKTFVPQRLLGRITRTLHAAPVLSRAMVVEALAAAALDPELSTTDLPDANLADAVEVVRMTPAVLSLDELSKLWSVFFQTPYALSVVYEAAVVLVEDDTAEPEPGLPVSRRNTYVLPFRQPTVDRVESTAGPQAPIVWNTTVRVLGRELRGQVTRVRVGDSLVEPSSIDDGELKVDLSSMPTASRRSGITGLQVVHDILMGTPELPHRGFESNLVAFVLRPSLTGIAASDPQATVTLDVDPPVRAKQRLTLLLNERSGDATGSYSFALEPPSGDLTTVLFPIAGVETGDYFVRLRVDGAESPMQLEEDEDDLAFGTLVGPEVHIP